MPPASRAADTGTLQADLRMLTIAIQNARNVIDDHTRALNDLQVQLGIPYQDKLAGLHGAIVEESKWLEAMQRGNKRAMQEFTIARDWAEQERANAMSCLLMRTSTS